MSIYPCYLASPDQETLEASAPPLNPTPFINIHSKCFRIIVICFVNRYMIYFVTDKTDNLTQISFLLRIKIV